jgi:hypothetical protein
VKVAALVDDLMFASRVQELLGAAGHDVVLNNVEGADVAVVDLFSGWVDKPAVPSLGVYAHTDAAMKQRADAAGYELVVPRSRFMREGPELVQRLST